MKKYFLLLPMVILAGCSSNTPAPVVNANSSSDFYGSNRMPYVANPVSRNMGWQTQTQPAPVPAPMPSQMAPTYVQPAVAPQPLYNREVEPTSMETKTVTQTVVVKKKVPKQSKPEQYVEIPRDAQNKPVYSQMTKGFYDSDTYTVRKGDTMYLIGYISGKDVNELARLNNLKEPYQLAVGQKIKLSNGDGQKYEIVEETVTKQVQVPVQPQVTYSQGPNGTTYSSQGDITGPVKAVDGSQIAPPQRNTNPVVASAPVYTNVQANTVMPEATQTSAVSSVKWQWPTAGNVVSGFSSNEGGNKGIDIAGSKGQEVRAAAAGRVVYAGNALRGYGNLIIIKHNDDFLSAYAHNDSLKVDEQDEVKAGQKIATMGNTGTDSTKLHFEIRYKGKSVDPTRYLPRR